MSRRPVLLLVGALAAIGIAAALLGPAEPAIVQLAGTVNAPHAQAKEALLPRPVLATTPAARTALARQASLRLIVRYKHGLPAAVAAKAEASVHAHVVKSIPDLDMRVVTVSSTDEVSAAMSALKARSDVVSVERDAVVAPQDDLPNDPSFPAGNDAVGGGSWGWAMTHTTQAWDITKGSSGVVIAILDTGIKTAGLDDFNVQIASTYNAMNGTADVTTNAGNHGTYVAGIAGLALSNGMGNAGFCPGCRLMIVQVGTDSGANWSDMAAGLTWAADHGARVANMSWAGTSDSSAMQSATAYAHSKGVVMAASAGNSNCDCVTYPSADPYVLGVAGLSNSGAKAGDSNYGTWVAIAAPEGNMTAWPSINGCNGCPYLPGYAPVGGTSSAAPVVAGIAGLLFSAGATLTNTQVEQALESTAAPVSFSVAHGRVDALAALGSLGFSDPQAASTPVNTVQPQIFVETNGDWNYKPLTVAPQVGQVLLRGQGGWTGSAPMKLTSVQWERCDSTGAGCSLAAAAPSYAVQSTDVGYTFEVIAVVTNGVGSTSRASAPSAPVAGAAPSTTTASPSPTPASSPTPSPSPTPSASPSPSPSPIGSPTPSPAPTTSQTQTFSGSLSSRNPTRSFSVAVGSGAAHARLTFTKCASLNLSLASSGGTLVASASGPSVVVLDVTLTGGTYTYSVSGGKCSFTLTVTAPTA